MTSQATSSQSTVLTVGNFDGVHRGHQQLIAQAVELAKRHGITHVTAITFTTPPVEILYPDRTTPRLMNEPQRIAALKNAGATEVQTITPDQDFLSLSPQAFVQQMVERFAPIGWVEGDNFHFGANRAGDMTMLKQFGQQYGFEVQTLQRIQQPLSNKIDAPVSSSLIRWLISQGRIVDATICLGHPYAIEGTVIRGEQRGRTIGFPTINLRPTVNITLPACGVYSGYAMHQNVAYPAAISIGHKPTFNDDKASAPTIEAHLIGFEGDLYEQIVDVIPMRWLRDQQAYANVDQLIDQLKKDIAQSTPAPGITPGITPPDITAAPVNHTA